MARLDIAVVAAACAAWCSALPFGLAQAPAPVPKPLAEVRPLAGGIESVLFTAFPEADAYSCIVRDVKQASREAIERRLPFKLHFQELGAHTLFVAFRGRKPVGLAYLRSEEAPWGLTEIAWFLSLDLRVQGFEFLRGRGPGLATLEQSDFPQLLRGRDLDAIVEMVTRGEAVFQDLVPGAAHGFATTVLRSSAKALVVTHTVWPEEIAKLRDQAAGYDVFPAAARFTRRTGAFEVATSAKQQQVEVKVIHAYDTNGALLGSLLRTAATDADAAVVVRWIVDREQRLLTVQLQAPLLDPELRVACTQLEGTVLGNPPAGDNPLKPVANGLAAFVRQAGAGQVVR